MRSLVVSTVFLAAVVCVCLAKSPLQNKNYSKLGGNLKKFIDLAIIRANEKLNYGHLNFEGTGQIARVPLHNGVVIDVRLRKTTCSKDTNVGYKHRPECPFKLLRVRCMVCSNYGATRALLNENNYLIDCVSRKQERTRHSLWDSRCHPRLTGSGSLLSATVDDDGVTPTTDLSNFIQNPSVPVITALADIPEASVQSQPPVPGLQVYKGSDFNISCYIRARLPNTFFHLTLNDTETRDKVAGDSGRATFLFPAADPAAHQGIYRCAYEVTGDDGETITFRSEPLPLTVYYYDSDDYSVYE